MYNATPGTCKWYKFKLSASKPIATRRMRPSSTFHKETLETLFHLFLTGGYSSVRESLAGQ